jgi:hypothetical protein
MLRGGLTVMITSEQIVAFLKLLSAALSPVIALVAVFIAYAALKASRSGQKSATFVNYRGRYSALRDKEFFGITDDKSEARFLHMFWSMQMEQYHDWENGIIDGVTYKRWLKYLKIQFTNNCFGFDDTLPIARAEARFCEGWSIAKGKIKDTAFIRAMTILQSCSLEETFSALAGGKGALDKQHRRLQDQGLL